LKLEQSFALRAFGDVSALIPDQRFSAYHRTLAQALSLPEAAVVIDNMLTDLSSSLSALRVEAQIADTNVIERRARTVTWISAAVAVIAVPASLIFGFLGINVQPVAGDTFLFDARYNWAYFCIILLFVLAVLIGWVGSRRQSGESG
jgi:Mg2+ and Co2+ transporter CorA